MAAPALALGKKAIAFELARRAAKKDPTPRPPPRPAPMRIHVDARSADSGVVVVQPPEQPPLLRFGKDRVRVLTRKGVRIVTVDRAPGLTAKELLVAGIIGGLGVAYWSYSGGGSVLGIRVPSSSSSLSKNALGIPFGKTFPGGGTNPLNYVFP